MWFDFFLHIIGKIKKNQRNQMKRIFFTRAIINHYIVQSNIEISNI